MGRFDNDANITRDGAENTSCHIRVPGIPSLFKKFASKGMALQEPVPQPWWGMKELYVIDPHDHLIKSGEAVS